MHATDEVPRQESAQRPAAALAARAGLSFAALMVLLPFLNPVHTSPIPTFYEEALAIGLGLLALACLALDKGIARIAIPGIALWTAALSGFVILQAPWTPAPYAESAQLMGLYLMWAAAIMCVGAGLRTAFSADKVTDVLAAAILLGALVSAGAGWIQILELTESFPGILAPVRGAAWGFFAQHNLHGNYLVVGAAGLAYLWSSRRVSLAVALPAGLLLASAIELAASRASALTLGWLLLFSLWYFRIGRGSPLPRRFLASVIVLVAAVAICGAINGLGSSAGITGRLVRFVSEGGDTAMRLAIYEAAIRTWLSAPYFGVGVGGFAWSHFRIVTDWVGVVPMNAETNAHDIVLQWLAETGLAGTTILVLGLSFWLARSLRELAGHCLLPQALAIAITGVEFVHSAVEFPLWQAEFLGLAALMMGMADSRTIAIRSAILHKALAAGVVLVGGTLLVSTARDYLDMRRWGFGIPPEVRRDARVRAEEQKVIERLRRSILLPYVDVGLALSLQLSSTDLEKKISFNERVMHFWPVFPVVRNQIVFLALAGRDAEGLELLEHLARLQPALIGELRAMLEQIPGTELPDASPLRSRTGELARRTAQ